MKTGPHTLRIGTDIGGTFTDFVVIDPATGEMWLEKTLTTPTDPAQGIMNGLADLRTKAGLEVDRYETLVHGTTLIINALIERKGKKTALITTSGFRDVLEMRNSLRYDVYDLQLEYPEPLVPRPLRLAIEERTLSDGTIVTKPSVDRVLRIVETLVAADVASVAICFLNSHANGANERSVESMLRELAPAIHVSVSSDVLPQIKEYERTSTTVANAYVKPTVKDYLDRLMAGLQEKHFSGGLFIMQSGGGVVAKDSAKQYPIRMLESGPAGGVAAARWWGDLIGERNLLCFDMGGTTAKLCTVIDGQATVTDEYEAARLHHFKKGSGLAINVPVLDLLEIGTGGGSIAHIDKLGLLTVGPESAGAMPGPACYAKGGLRPTVTDSDVVLGYLDPNNFLGGSMKLAPELAQTVIEANIGRLLDMTVFDAAYRIHNLANEDMSAAARLHLAERGEDAAGLTMVAYGGAGPVHAYGLARKLGIRRLVVPPAAGVMSALGMLVEDLATDQVRSFRQALVEAAPAAMQEQFDRMGAETAVLLQANAGDVRYARSVDLRYRGQGYDVHVPIREVPADAAELEKTLRAGFEAVYRSRYGRIYEDVPVDIVNLRITVSRHNAGAAFKPKTLASSQAPAAQPKGHRTAFFGPRWGTLCCDVFDRNAVVPGFTHQGPAFVEDRETTVVVGPEGSFEINSLGMLIIDVV